MTDTKTAPTAETPGEQYVTPDKDTIDALLDEQPHLTIMLSQFMRQVGFSEGFRMSALHAIAKTVKELQREEGDTQDFTVVQDDIDQHMVWGVNDQGELVDAGQEALKQLETNHPDGYAALLGAVNEGPDKDKIMRLSALAASLIDKQRQINAEAPEQADHDTSSGTTEHEALKPPVSAETCKDLFTRVEELAYDGHISRLGFERVLRTTDPQREVLHVVRWGKRHGKNAPPLSLRITTAKSEAGAHETMYVWQYNHNKELVVAKTVVVNGITPLHEPPSARQEYHVVPQDEADDMLQLLDGATPVGKRAETGLPTEQDKKALIQHLHLENMMFPARRVLLESATPRIQNLVVDLGSSGSDHYSISYTAYDAAGQSLGKLIYAIPRDKNARTIRGYQKDAAGKVTQLFDHPPADNERSQGTPHRVMTAQEVKDLYQLVLASPTMLDARGNPIEVPYQDW
jgi:hypothetical protein